MEFLAGGRELPLSEAEGMRLFELHRAIIESQREPVARSNRPADDELTVTAAGIRTDR